MNQVGVVEYIPTVYDNHVLDKLMFRKIMSKYFPDERIALFEYYKKYRARTYDNGNSRQLLDFTHVGDPRFLDLKLIPPRSIILAEAEKEWLGNRTVVYEPSIYEFH